MAAIEGETVADTIYAIDQVADDALLGWFEKHWPDVEVVSEGLDEPVVSARDPQWTVIVDTIDGTRGLMYDKRAAWCLAAAAPRGGSLRDVVAAAMTELPTAKQGAADQLSGDARRRASSPSGSTSATGAAPRSTVRPSTATDLEHGFERAREVLRAGQGRARPSSRRSCSAGSAAATCSTTSTSRRAGSCTS